MRSLKEIADRLIQAEVDQAKYLSRDGGDAAEFWGGLVSLILNDLPPATEGRIAETILDYLIGDADAS